MPAGSPSATITANMVVSPQSVKNVKNALGRITGQASEFQKSLDASTARVFAFGATTTVITGVSMALKALVSTTIDVEKKLIEVQSILGSSGSEFEAYRDTIFSVAQSTGQSFDVVAEAASELARQGLSAEESAKRLEAALILTRVSGLDSAKSVGALTAAINGFASAGLTAEQITNKLVAVDQAFAVSSKDLAEAFSRAGSTAEDAGVSFDELLGIVTAVQQTTSRGGAVIGNAFKSIFTRLSRGTVIDDLKELGVQIDASQTGIQKLQALSSALSTITDPTQSAAIKELAGGVYQINLVSAALKDLGTENSLFSQATAKSANATNEAYKKNEELSKSMASQINALVIGMTNLAEKVGQVTFAPLFKELLSYGTKFSAFLNEAFDPETGNKFIQGIFKTIGSFLSGPAVVLFAGAFIKIFTLIASYAKEGFKSVLSIGTQAEKIKTIQDAIGVVLKNNAGLNEQIESSNLSQKQKHDLIIDAIKQENILLEKQKQLALSLATAVYDAGVRKVDIKTGEFQTRKGKALGQGFIPNFAGGFIPSYGSQMEKQKAKEHGYTAGAVKQTRIHDGNGGSFNSFVNTREKITTFRNQAGKKATIVKPPNGFGKGTSYAEGAKQFNAEGFIPNFAAGNSIGFWNSVANLFKRPDPLAFAKNDLDISAAKYILEQRKAGVGQTAFSRIIDQNKRSLSTIPQATASIAGAVKSRDVENSTRTLLVANKINSLEDFDKLAGSKKSIELGGQTIYRANAENYLKRKAQAGLQKEGEAQALRAENFIDTYNLDANKLGGILLVSPRFGLMEGEVSARMEANKISSFYNNKTLSGAFNKTEDKNAKKELIKLTGIKKTGVPQAGKDVLGVSSDINELFAPAIVGLASKLYGDMFNVGDRKDFSTKLGGFKSSTTGGILPAGAEGQIFEAASKVALATMQEMPEVFDSKTENRPFDFSNASAMSKIFGVNAQRGEAKRLGGDKHQDQIDGILTKVFNDPEYGQRATSEILSQRASSVNRELAAKKQAEDKLKKEAEKAKGIKNSAGGFVPNFSAIKDAIAREKSFGLSDSQIYVDKNSALRSSRNPMGVGVFNTRDEPNGPNQGINRAKREGKNPKSYGMGSGFVPNFATPDLSSYTGPRTDNSKVIAFQKSLDFLFKSFEDGNLKLKPLIQLTKDIGKNLGITGDAAKKLNTDLKSLANQSIRDNKSPSVTNYAKGRMPDILQEGRQIVIDSSKIPKRAKASFGQELFGSTVSNVKGGLVNKKRQSAKDLGLNIGPSTLVNRNRSSSPQSSITKQISQGIVGEFKSKKQKFSTSFEEKKTKFSSENSTFKKIDQYAGKIQGSLLSLSLISNSLLSDMPVLQNVVNGATTALSSLSLLSPAFPAIVAGFSSIVTSVGAASLALAAFPVAIAAGAAFLINSAAKEGIASEEAAQASIEAESRQRAKSITFNRTAKEAGVLDPKDLIKNLGSSEEGLNIKKLQKELNAAYDSQDNNKIEEVRQKLIKAFQEGADAADPFVSAAKNAKAAATAFADSFSSSLKTINSGIDLFLNKLEKQELIQNIASNVPIREGADFGKQVADTLKISQLKNKTSQSQASFLQSFTGSEGIGAAIKTAVEKNFNFGTSSQKEISQKVSTGAFQQEAFLSYLQKGAEGLKTKIEEAVGPLEGNEAGQKFYESVLASSKEFRDTTIETYQEAYNLQINLSNEIKANSLEIIQAQKQALSDLPSILAKIQEGPSIDPLALFKKFEEAAKLLKSGKSGDVQKGTQMLAGASQDTEAFRSLYGQQSLEGLQKRAGLNVSNVAQAKESATFGKTIFDSIEQTIRSSLDGGGQRRVLSSLEEAKVDPSKINEFIDKVSQEFTGRLASKGQQIKGSLGQFATQGPTIKDINKNLATAPEIQLGNKDMIAGLNKAISEFSKNAKDPKIFENLKEKLESALGKDRGGKVAEAYKTAAGKQPDFSPEDDAVKGLTERQKALQSQLKNVEDQVTAFGKAFEGTTLPKTIESLSKAVQNASEGVTSFSALTSKLDTISKDISKRIGDLEAIVGKAGR